MSSVSEVYSGPMNYMNQQQRLNQINQVNQTYQNQSNQILREPVKISGINNGTFGLGMYGIMLPESLNGPLGFINNPLPYKLELPTLLDGPKYNSQLMNVPKYNEQSFLNVSGFTFNNNFSTTSSPLEPDRILYINP